jgi:hypothetical protein
MSNIGSLLYEVISATFATDDAAPSVSSEVIDIALASWCIHGLRSLNKNNTDAITHFAFASFLLFLQSMVDTLVESSYYMSQGEIVTSVWFLIWNLYSASLQFYHAYIAWSLVYTVVNEPEGRFEAHGVMAASPVAAESKLGVSLLSHSELGEGTAASI